MAIKYARELVISKAEQIFPNEEIASIMKILDSYGKESQGNGKERVQLAILKICKGDLGELKRMVDLANVDYGDVLCPAEYPKQSSQGFVGWEELSKKEQDEVIEEDLRQYLDWLQ